MPSFGHLCPFQTLSLDEISKTVQEMYHFSISTCIVKAYFLGLIDYKFDSHLTNNGYNSKPDNINKRANYGSPSFE
jgi:hypothetical protein